LVRRTKAQAAGQRKPRTMATARRREMLPPYTSMAATRTPTANQRGPQSQPTQARRRAVQTPTKAGQGRRERGAMSWRKAGE
jgi:hypothetical protein